MARITKAEFQEMKNVLFQVQGEDVEIAEGFEVYVSTFTAKAAFDNMMASSKNGEEMKEPDVFDIVRLCTYDADGELLFESREEIEQLPTAVFGKLSSAAIRMNSLLQGEEAIEDAEKNLEEVGS